MAERINVVGTSCSGKSTLARALAERLNAPYIELDAIFWDRDWTPVQHAPPSAANHGLGARLATGHHRGAAALATSGGALASIDESIRVSRGTVPGLGWVSVRRGGVRLGRDGVTRMLGVARASASG